jgi:anaerobic magnesium-protoporphyrin IX monomethyl ester cyclase
MKVTFLVPPPLDGKPAAERIFGCNYGIYTQQNIFILYPATVLKEKGYDVCVKDCPMEKVNKDEFVRYIKKDESDAYVFYTVFLSKATDISARNIISEIKENPKFIFIGTEPTCNPSAFISNNSFVIRGEPEDTIVELVRVIGSEDDLSNVKGISYIKDGESIDTESREVINNLDRLPFPDRTLLKPANYHNPKLRLTPFTTMISSRGCAYNCYYCVPNSLDFAREIEFKRYDPMRKKPPVRMRSAKNIIEEIKMLHSQGFNSISFLDDQFVWNKERIIKICDGIKDLNMEWSCLARADHLEDELLIKSMAEAGCKYVDIGIESFNQEILDYIKKDLKVESIYRAVGLLKRYGIEPELNILIGSCPLETKNTIEHTIAESMKLDVDYVLFSICAPFPHTTFSEIAKKNNWMVTKNYVPIDPIRQSLISYPHLTKEDMEEIIRKAYLRFYFRPSYILKRLRKVRGLRDFLNKFKTAMTILKKK